MKAIVLFNDQKIEQVLVVSETMLSRRNRDKIRDRAQHFQQKIAIIDCHAASEIDHILTTIDDYNFTDPQKDLPDSNVFDDNRFCEEQQSGEYELPEKF